MDSSARFAVTDGKEIRSLWHDASAFWKRALLTDLVYLDNSRLLKRDALDQFDGFPFIEDPIIGYQSCQVTTQDHCMACQQPPHEFRQPLPATANQQMPRIDRSFRLYRQAP